MSNNDRSVIKHVRGNKSYSDTQQGGLQQTTTIYEPFHIKTITLQNLGLAVSHAARDKAYDGQEDCEYESHTHSYRGEFTRIRVGSATAKIVEENHGDRRRKNGYRNGTIENPCVWALNCLPHVPQPREYSNLHYTADTCVTRDRGNGNFEMQMKNRKAYNQEQYPPSQNATDQTIR